MYSRPVFLIILCAIRVLCLYIFATVETSANPSERQSWCEMGFSSCYILDLRPCDAWTIPLV